MEKNDKGFTQRLGERASNIFAWAKKDKWNMVLVILVILALLIGVLILLHYFLPVIVLIIIAIAYFVYTIINHNAIVAHQMMLYVRQLGLSAIFSVHHALGGLEKHLMLPNTHNKGLFEIFHHKISGVHVYTLVFTQLPGAAVPVLPFLTCEALRQVLNSNLVSVFNNAVFGDILQIQWYAVSVQTGNGQVAIRVVPVIDNHTQAFVANHQAQTTKNKAMGNTPNAVQPGGNIAPGANPAPITPAPTSAAMNAPASPAPANGNVTLGATPVPANATLGATPAPVGDGDLVDDEI